MRLRFDPFPLIFAQGDVVTRLVCLEFFGLSDSPQAKDCLLKLVGQQRSDGSFASSFDAEQWGMLETVRHTLALLKMGMPPQGVNVDAAVRTILRQQRADGGWSENHALQLPPERTWLSSERSITWLTADVVDLLCQIGLARSSECQAAVGWLRAMQNQHGGWPSLAPEAGGQPGTTSDPDATAQIAFLMGELYGEEDPVYLRAKGLFDRYLGECAEDAERGYWIRRRDGQRQPLEVYHLTHLLLSWVLEPPRRILQGYDLSEPRVRRIMEALADIQREDGGWSPFWTAQSDPVYTLLAVKVLVLTGMLAWEDLEARARPYAF